jgi:hypothetical protein
MILILKIINSKKIGNLLKKQNIFIVMFLLMMKDFIAWRNSNKH